MKYLHKDTLIILFISVIIISCNTKMFVLNNRVINTMKGIIVFTDNESRKERNMGNGDIFTDSLIHDFFIPYNFQKKVLTKEDIDKALFSKQVHNISFFYFIRDCNETLRAAYIKADCTPILLDKNIDEYVRSNKIYAVPATIHFTKSNSNTEYYDQLHKNLFIYYKNKKINLAFNKGELEVWEANILEYDWSK